MTENSPQFQRYLWRAGAWLFGGIAAVLAFVVLVDPYGLYGVFTKPGFNSVKPGLTRYQEDIKVAHAKAMQPEVVIVGNSRAEIGFDPQTVSRLAGGRPAYNLAVPGVAIGASVRQLEALQQAGVKPRTVILGIEFLDFVAQRKHTAPGAEALARASGWYPLLWRFDTLFSLQTLADAIETLRIQRDSEAATISPQGFNPLLEYNGHVRNEGHFRIFDQRAREYAKVYLQRLKPGLRDERLAELDQMLKISGEGGADLRLVIYPYHAQILALFERAGLAPAFDQWKDAVLAHVADARRAYPAARFTVIDFSGYHAFSCEPIPEPGDMRSRTRWYWEAGHFKKELGDVMLSQIMAGPDQAANAGMPGRWLEPGNARREQERNAAELAHCHQENPTMFTHVDEIVRQIN